MHLAFYAAIDEPLEHEDPSDRLLDVESQLAWLREIGFIDVDLLLEVARDGPAHRRQARRLVGTDRL